MKKPWVMECFLTVPSVHPGSVRSAEADRRDHAPTDTSRPTPPQYAPTQCPRPARDRRWKNHIKMFSGLHFLRMKINHWGATRHMKSHFLQDGAVSGQVRVLFSYWSCELRYWKD